MNYWLITDTHFGHKKMREYCGRPPNFEELILKRVKTRVLTGDVLIHLGDFCIGNDAFWHKEFMSGLNGKKWLVRGNHDRKTAAWYIRNGWDFVADQITLEIFGVSIVLSHTPVADTGYDFNVHGHFHNSDHHRHEVELQRIRTPKHRLIFMEHKYQPLNLRTIISR